MSVPYFESMIDPTFQALKNLGGEGHIKEIEEKVAELLNLSNEDMLEVHRGNRTKLGYRLAWSRNYLKRVGLLSKVGRAYWRLTDEGKRTVSVDNNDTAIEERFIMSNTFLVDEEMSKAEGLAIAYLYSTMSISLDSSEKWNVDEVSLRFSDEGYDDLLVKVKHASQVPHVERHKDWIASRIGIKLKATDLPVDQKEIRLRDDHGKDVLLRFSRKLVRSPYIIKVMNSMPFNSHDHHFIRNCYEDGRIEIVLVRSDKGWEWSFKRLEII
jgi:hypothetical protein